MGKEAFTHSRIVKIETESGVQVLASILDR